MHPNGPIPRAKLAPPSTPHPRSPLRFRFPFQRVFAGLLAAWIAPPATVSRCLATPDWTLVKDPPLRIIGTPVIADFDNDDDLDLIATCYSTNLTLSVQILRNQGERRFVWMPPIVHDVLAERLAVGDYDRDGWLDLAMGGQTAGGLAFSRVYHNDGGLRFTRAAEGIPDASNASVAWGDMDRDGDLDLLHPHYPVPGGEPVASIFLNDGLGRFHPIPLDPAAISTTRAAWRHWDLDGELDLVADSWSGRQVGWPFLEFTPVGRGAGGHHFDPVTLRMLPMGNPVTSAWADADADGRLDALAWGLGPDVVMFRQKEDGTLGAAETVVPDRHLYQAIAGDADNDGDLDYLAAAYSEVRTELLLIRNDGAQYSTHLLDHEGYRFMGGAWGDLDRDGRLDFVHGGCCEEWQDKSLLLMGSGSAPNARPSIPSGLTARQRSNGDIELGWTPASDRETSPPLITYEVRVGARPGGLEIVSPESNPVTGFRKVAAPGSERTPFRRLRGLLRGTYYWTVQSVDTALAGSEWAPEARFQVTNTAPTISQIPEVRLAPSQTLRLPFEVSDSESAPEALEAFADAGGSALIASASAIAGGTPSQRMLELTIRPGAIGTTRVTFGAVDPEGLRGERQLRVIVEAFSRRTLIEDPAIRDVGFSLTSPADFDGDGDLDLLVDITRLRPEGLVGQAVLARNDGSSRFVTSELPRLPGRAAINDFDNDGDLDLVDGPELFENDGTGSFTLRPSGIPAGWQIPPFSGDMDGDGDADLVLAGFTDTLPPVAVVQVFRNASGTFSADPPLTELPHGGPLCVADFDRDGDLDIVCGLFNTPSDPSSFGTRLYLNHGDGRFDAPREIPGMAFSPSSSEFWFEDDDDDGDVDIVQFHHDTGHYSRLTNDGHGRFQSEPRAVRYSRVIPDINLDGRSDAFASVTDPGPWQGQVFLHYQEADATYSRQDMPVSWNQQPFLGDFDGDGDLDLPFESETFGPPDGRRRQIHWWRNNTDRTNHPPTAPPITQGAVSDGHRLRLAWSAAGDDYTPAHQLTYDLRVGRRPGAFDIVSPGPPMPRPGNAGNVLHREFSHLPLGAYYWSVRSVDGQFRTGPWTAEQFAFHGSLHLTPQPGGMLLGQGPAGFMVQIESSSDLRNWSLHTTLRIGSEGTFQVPLPNAESPSYLRALVVLEGEPVPIPR